MMTTTSTPTTTSAVSPAVRRAAGPTGCMRDLERLVSPYGLVSHVTEHRARNGEPDFNVHLARLGSAARALRNLGALDLNEDIGNSDGAGTGLVAERARLLAVAEALERYSVAAWHDDDLVIAAESELTEAHVSPSRWAQCSPTELAAPGSHLAAYDPTMPIRWTRAWSLTRKASVLVPAIAVHLHMPYASRSEQFTRGITTGAAVHSDLRAATLNGLLEVVERDAIALVWLQRLRLPELRIDPAVLDEVTLAHHRVGTGTDLRIRLHDATTDFGVPVVYAVQTAAADPVLSQIVAATCDVSPQVAVAKIHRELASLRVALAGAAAGLAGREPDPAKVSVTGGAIHNAAASRRHVFDFLLEGPRPVHDLADMPDLSTAPDPLATVVERLAARGAEALVVDLTTDEARQAGMHVVKVLVPEAMPVSFIHTERFLGTPRLYEAPARMGHPVSPEHAVNPEHQPFA